MAVQEKLLTAEEFGKLPNDGKKYDLVKGAVVEVCRPKYGHGKLQGKFARFIDEYLDDHAIGNMTTETGYILARNRDTVLGPDAAFFSTQRWGNPEIDAYIPIGPDLVVEIVSTYDKTHETHEKIRAYFEAGTRLLWLVYPSTQQVHIYHGMNSEIRVVGIDGALAVEDLLPGFTLSMRDIFKGLTNEE